jgi:hypothetical protein
MKGEKLDTLEMVSCYVQLAVYLVIIGAITCFRSRISSHAQRGWFMSWPLIGIIYRCIIGLFSYEDVAKEYVQEVKIYRVAQQAHEGIWHGSPEYSGWGDWFGDASLEQQQLVVWLRWCNSICTLSNAKGAIAAIRLFLALTKVFKFSDHDHCGYESVENNFC